MNVVALMGRLTKEPAVKTLESGSVMCNVTIAVDRRKQGETDFINCQAWGKYAEFIGKYFHKGSPIAITGRIQTRSYEKDGRNNWVTEVVIEDARFVPRTSTEQNSDNDELVF